jgi:alkylmercury lyase
VSRPHACTDAALLAGVPGHGALPRLLRLLATGTPVDLDEFAQCEPAGADLVRVVRAQPGTEWDRDGRLVGFGLTTRPTRHRFSVGGVQLYTWCAADTLFFTVILGASTVVASECPVTGAPIRLELAPDGVSSVTPPDTVVSQRHREGPVGDLRADVCDQGHFFASRSAGAAWSAEHPDATLLDVADAFAECGAACRDLGWATPEAARR